MSKPIQKNVLPIKYFSEICDNDGNLRENYRQIYPVWNSLSKRARRKLYQKSKDLLSGDYYLDPLPRILAQREFDFIKKGVEQRAQAILAFLCDYYGKGKRWQKVLPARLLNRIIRRNHSMTFLGEIKPDNLSFPYGPDIIRNQGGCWRIVEDSAGNLGGIGDLVAGQKIVPSLVPAFGSVLKAANDSKSFFLKLASYYHWRAARNGGMALLCLEPPDVYADNENRRLAKIFRSLNISVFTFSDRSGRIESDQSGIYFVKRGRRSRIGYLVFRGNPEHLELRGLLRYIKNPRRYVMSVRAMSSPNSYTCFLNSLLQGHAHTNFSPGVEFVNDKMFGIFVDSLVKFYLKESPHIESIPAKPLIYKCLQGPWKTDLSLLRSLPKHKNSYVIKRVDQDGGEGVWIGHKQSLGDFKKLIAKIREDPEKYILQEFEHLSVLEDRIVDLRLHAHVDTQEIITSNCPWGRANWLHDDGKVNISSRGFMSPVFVLQGQM